MYTEEAVKLVLKVMYGHDDMVRTLFIVNIVFVYFKKTIFMRYL